ncbi:hypothetical protein BDA99DRAFT_512682 [Phascolomyces articulosus]|uniref:Uncharacterized protein n=1 Tax=Phascolomyces articulosus TaxID=60185 RepID=A0AAD5K8I7_9FUNG|nr:hypothetical protein BDA99DRAFT_512682 [Phascolomyces articulosus]
MYKIDALWMWLRNIFHSSRNSDILKTCHLIITMKNTILKFHYLHYNNSNRNQHQQKETGVAAIPDTPKGLRYIDMVVNDGNYPMTWKSELSAILTRATPTLEHLHCSFCFTDDQFDSGHPPQHFAMPSLYSFSCTLSHTKSQKYVASLIRSSPQLVTVTIRNHLPDVCPFEDDLLDALTSLNHLKAIELHQEDVETPFIILL